MKNPIEGHLLPDTARVGQDGHLFVGGVRVADLAYEFGTPLFVYDEAHLRNRCRDVVSVFGDGATYATKAFLCKAMARLAHEEGMRLDVATGGEMHVALAAGVPADRLVLHGNNKSTDELAAAIDVGVGRIVVDSLDELERIERLAPSGRQIPVLLRLTPGVEAHTHEFVSTGQDDSKFGFTVSSGAAKAAVDAARSAPHLDLRGIHCHIGSQVLRVDSYARALEVIADFAAGFAFDEVVVGGGLGVAYTSDERAPGLTEWSSV
ncbi:MAG: alanine racemase, partial [Acidimicrobiia bacterium]|nr:alanine racemase [Acidimicrobiia bacterium]